MLSRANTILLPRPWILPKKNIRFSSCTTWLDPDYLQEAFAFALRGFPVNTNDPHGSLLALVAKLRREHFRI
jgi:hypothetical protein